MKLEELNLGSEWKSKDSNLNAIGPEGAKAIGEALKTNSSLTKLNLETSQMKGKVCFALLQFLTKDNEIRDEEAKSIGEALKTNTSLTKLNLEISQMKARPALLFLH